MGRASSSGLDARFALGHSHIQVPALGLTMDPDGPFKEGDRFLKYEIRSLLGRGGHAFVYAAYDAFLNTEVALKVIPSARNTGRDLAARARAEARVLVRIRHDNIVRVIDAGATDDNLVYLVMERLVGQDLRKALSEYGRLSVAEALTVAIQVADGVAAAHEAGAIHRDLKPENIFVQHGNRLKVLDFGIAKVLGYGAPTTRKDVLHGTVLYMAPEQLKGLGASQQSDVFALGTLLYEALHRHPVLLGGKVPSLRDVGWSQIRHTPPLLSDVDPAIPRHVARTVQRALMKKPEQRYASMGEFATAARAAFERTLEESRGAPPLRDLGKSSRRCSPQQRTASSNANTEVAPTPSFSTTRIVSAVQEVPPSSLGSSRAAPSRRPAPLPPARPGSLSTPPPAISGPRGRASSGTVTGLSRWVIGGAAVGIGVAGTLIVSGRGLLGTLDATSREDREHVVRAAPPSARFTPGPAPSASGAPALAGDRVASELPIPNPPSVSLQPAGSVAGAVEGTNELQPSRRARPRPPRRTNQVSAAASGGSDEQVAPARRLMIAPRSGAEENRPLPGSGLE